MEMITESYLTVAIIAYLVGSIPFGLIITKMAGKGDPLGIMNPYKVLPDQ